ncbi:MAG: NADH-quinone oxidoreductase subunit N, partial [Myxococcota bacterium]
MESLVLGPLATDFVLFAGILFILVTDLITTEKHLLGWGALLTLLAGLLATFTLGDTLSGLALEGAYLGDPTALWFKRIFLFSGVLATLGSIIDLSERFPGRQGEYWVLLLTSILGMSLLAGARDVVLFVVAFELMSVPLYALAAWNRDEPRAVEGAFKLYLLGAVSSVTLMFGVAILVGLANSTVIDEIALYASVSPSPMMLLGAVFVLGGVGFKLGVFPFHMWVPDTYQGATTPFVAFLSVAPKAGAMAALVRVLLAADGAMLAGVKPMLLTLAAATIVMGSLFALHQREARRLLAYSGVAHVGFMLMALAPGDDPGLAMLIVYLIVYVVSNMGAFLVVHAVTGSKGDELRLMDGLYARSGWLAGTMLLFLLSLAGIPFVAGFWSKIFVFWAAWQGSLWWLVVLAAMMSVVSLYYYLRMVDAVFMQAPKDDRPVTADFGTSAAIFICAALVVGIGVAPQAVVDPAFAAANAFEQEAPVEHLERVKARYVAQAEAIRPAETETEPEPTTIEPTTPEVLVADPEPPPPASPLAAYDLRIPFFRRAQEVPRRYGESLQRTLLALTEPPDGIDAAALTLVVEARAAASRDPSEDQTAAQGFADLIEAALIEAGVTAYRIDVFGSSEGPGQARNQVLLWIDDGERS